MPMREVYSLNLPGPPPDSPIMDPKMIVSACCWSDDGLLAFAMNSNKPQGYRGKLGYTSSPSIYVLHVDRPERHSMLCGGHEHDISHLSWAPSQVGMVLMSADCRNYICLWKPVKGLINRWVLHHRLSFSSTQLIHWLNTGPAYSLPPPFFSGNAATTTAAQQGQAGNMNAKGYDGKYRRDVVRRDAPTPQGQASVQSKSSEFVFKTPPGCLCFFALSRYGEARVFLELSNSPTGIEWASASTQLSTLELPDTLTRPSARSTSSTSSSEASSNQAVLFVQSATAIIRDKALMIAVADESQIVIFYIKCRFHPLKVTSFPHTRTQLKSDIRLFPLAKGQWAAPQLLLMTFNPMKSDELYFIYQMVSGGGRTSMEAGSADVVRLERLRLSHRNKSGNVNQANASMVELDAMIWSKETSVDLACTSGSTPISITITLDGQYIIIGYSDGSVESRFLDSLQMAPYESHVSVCGSVVNGCSSPTGNCALLLDSAGRAKVVEMAHPWALDKTATPQSIASHIVYQMEVSLAKLSEAWDALLALGGIMTSHPMAFSIMENVVKLLRENNKQMPDNQRRFYRHAYEIMTIKIHSMSAEHQFFCTSSEARLLLFYLLDCFRFALPVMPRGDQSAQRSAGAGISPASTSRLKALCSDMMLTMGESIVGLTVWNLKHATTNIKSEKSRQAQQGGADTSASARMLFGKYFLLDPEALTFTRDLLSYYLKKLRDNQPKETKDATANGTDNSTNTVAAPPPPPTPTVHAPPPVDDLSSMDVVMDPMGTDMGTSTMNLDSEAQTSSLPYDESDIKYLIEIIENILNAHKVPRNATGNEQNPQTVADKHRMFKEILAQNKVDPEIGLPEKLKARFSKPGFDQENLQNFLCLAMPQPGFLARACGYYKMDLIDRQDETVQTHGVPFKPLEKKRTFDEYTAEELAGGSSDANAGKRRALDVLTRMRVKGSPTRECNATGRVTSAQLGNPLYDRWMYACPVSSGRWRAPLEWDWEFQGTQSEEVVTYLQAPPP
uniref:Mediator complex subunit 16 n=1 Tax=Hanusia phi TaxID=3032 RepID=A0A7S0EZF2_9CRYP|mmetsp:Transcript_34363/g.77432  ORF Transcript_34363/g.77432 Transcript_34363/m.77432 type:complete len:1014 (+) Transcript_34363:211-3252(+)